MQNHPDQWLAVEWPADVLRDALAGTRQNEYAVRYAVGCAVRSGAGADPARRATTSQEAIDA